MKINCCFDFLQFCWGRPPQENDLERPINQTTVSSSYDRQNWEQNVRIQEWTERVWIERMDRSPVDPQALKEAIRHVQRNLSSFGLSSSSNCVDGTPSEREETPLIPGPRGCQVMSLAGRAVPIGLQRPVQRSLYQLMAEIEANEVFARASIREKESEGRQGLAQLFRYKQSLTRDVRTPQKPPSQEMFEMESDTDTESSNSRTPTSPRNV